MSTSVDPEMVILSPWESLPHTYRGSTTIGTADKWLFIAMLTALTILRTYYRIRYAHASSLRAFKYEPLYLIVLRYVLGVALLTDVWMIIFADRVRLWGNVDLSGVIQWVGLSITIGSLALLWWTHHTLKGAFSTTIETIQVVQLITYGPYKLVRHPMYLSYFLYFFGMGLLIENWLFTLLGSLIILSLAVVRIRYEEQALSEKFPLEYPRYTQRVHAFVPFVRTVNHSDDHVQA